MPGEGGGPRLDETEHTYTLVTASGSPLEQVQEIDCLFREVPKGQPHAGKSVGLEIPASMPPVRRAYELFNVTGARGECAYRSSYQLIRALRGNVWLYLDDGMGETRNINLFSRLTAVYVPPMVWVKLHMARGAECAVLDSVDDEAKERIADYAAFIAEAAARTKPAEALN